MLISFPTPYPDELMYSIIARYHLRSGNISFSNSKDELFKDKNAIIAYDFTCRLDVLAKQFPKEVGLNVDRLIDDYTLLPLYRPFSSESRYQYVRDLLKGSPGKSVSNVLGLTGTNVSNIKCLRFCYECMKVDEESVGEPYWHRSHQIAGVNVCHIHSTWLYESNIVVASQGRKFVITPLFADMAGKSLKPSPSSTPTPNHLLLSKAVFHLLKMNYPTIRGLLTVRYLERLRELNLITLHGGVRYQELTQRFCAFYGYDFLNECGFCIDPEERRNWLSQVLKNDKSHPHALPHLLIMNFLGIPLQDMADIEQTIIKGSINPFGEGPWPCPNKAASHYKKNVIKSCVVKPSHDASKVRGTFSCSCGIVFSRLKALKGSDDPLRWTSLLHLGHVMEKKILEWQKLGYSKKKISGILGVTRARVAKFLLSKQKESQSKPGLKSHEDLDLKKEKYRRRYLYLVKKYPKKSRSEIAHMKNSGYSWLYRKDYSWLMKNQPPKRRGPPIQKIKRKWQKVDNVISNKIKEIANRLLLADEKPVQLHYSTILHELALENLTINYLERLPLTKDALNDVIETTEDYQVRRIFWAVENIRRKGEALHKTSLMIRAGISTGRSYPVKVMNALDSALK